MKDLTKELTKNLVRCVTVTVAMFCFIGASCYILCNTDVSGIKVVIHTIFDMIALVTGVYSVVKHNVNCRAIVASFDEEVYEVAVGELADTPDYYFSRHGELKELNRNHPLWYILPFHKDYFDADHHVKLTYCGENIELCNLHAICETGRSGHFTRIDSFVGQICKVNFTTENYGDLYVVPKNPSISNSYKSYEKPKPRCSQPLHEYQLKDSCIANYYTVWTSNDDLAEEVLNSTVMGNILDIAMNDSIVLSFVITGNTMYMALDTGVLSAHYELDYDTAKNISVEHVTESLRGVLDRILAYKSMLSKPNLLSTNGEVVC